MEDQDGSAQLLARFDRMTRLHAQNADTIAFLATKEQRLTREMAAQRESAASGARQLTQLRAGVAAAAAKVGALRAEESRLAALLASAEAQPDAALEKLQQDGEKLKQDRVEFEAARGDARLAQDLDNLRFAHEADREVLEKEASDLLARLGSQSMSAKMWRDEVNKQDEDNMQRIGQQRREVEHAAQQIQVLKQAMQAEEKQFEQQLQQASAAVAEGASVPSMFEMADSQLIDRYKRSLLDLDRELARLHAKARATVQQRQRQRQHQHQHQRQHQHQHG